MSTATKPIILDETGQAIVEQLSLIGGSSSVHYTPDINKTSAEKLQARTNIGAGTSNFSGDYNDLSNQPAIPSKTSDITNDSGFIDNTVNNLTNYRSSSDQDVIDNTLQPKTDNLLSTNDKTVVGGMNEINSIAKGATQAVSYGNISTMVTALNAMASTQYRTGQNIYIVTLDVPDLWVSSVEQSSVPYTYVDDATFVNALVTNGYVQVGYYKLSAMETNKVDLSNYYTKSQTDTALANKVAKTDYATGSVGGVVKTYPSYFGTDCGSTGFFYGSGFNMTQYASASNVALISKQTLENVLDNESIRIDKTQSLSSAQKSQAESNIGISSETWTFTLADSTTVTKVVKVGS